MESWECKNLIRICKRDAKTRAENHSGTDLAALLLNPAKQRGDSWKLWPKAFCISSSQVSAQNNTVRVLGDYIRLSTSSYLRWEFSFLLFYLFIFISRVFWGFSVCGQDPTEPNGARGWSWCCWVFIKAVVCAWSGRLLEVAISRGSTNTSFCINPVPAGFQPHHNRAPTWNAPTAPRSLHRRQEQTTQKALSKLCPLLSVHFWFLLVAWAILLRARMGA